MGNVNKKFRDMFPDLPYTPTVDLTSCNGASSSASGGTSEINKPITFSDLIMNDHAFNLVSEGKQEGIVVVLKHTEDFECKDFRPPHKINRIPGDNTCSVLKWKNGFEPPGESVKKLTQVRDMLSCLPNDSEHAGANMKNSEHIRQILEAVFSADSKHLESLRVIIDRLLSVYKNTERIDLNADGTVKVQKKIPSSKDNSDATGDKSLKKPHPNKVYSDAVASARTKFDHCDFFFRKSESGKEEYIGLIADEALQDVVDTLEVSTEEHGKEEWKKQHRDRVAGLLEKDWKKFGKGEQS